MSGPGPPHRPRTARRTLVPGSELRVMRRECGTMARVLLGAACAALSPASPGPSLLAARGETPRGVSRLAAGPAPPRRAPADPDPGRLPLGGNDRQRTDRLWQDVEPRCHSGRDETVTGRGRGRRTRLPSGRCFWNESAWTLVFPGARGFLEAEFRETAAWGSRSSSESCGGADRGTLHSLTGAPRRGGQAERRRGPKSCARAARGRCGLRGCRLVPAAVGPAPSPATEGAPARPPLGRLHWGKRTATLERLNKA
ncbi:unnamed protein product [Rangifer tarandus platyrhynchus]|uniref:Uncharacterized protein n=2 Tax=Rangifer tarandus platyrhynchus TaxID=3082113 RepID=A0ABN8Y5M2_RANTA|nr:unnamed protein product [Rangifer tarandus platyrhynchus]CAI9695933.1 unnamed protein product [Rangifer tarandus platyrhynchus]